MRSLVGAAVTEPLCRAAAIIIAVLAVIDPACAIQGVSGARVHLLSSAGASDADVARVRDTLSASVTIVDDAQPPIDATVIVGRAAPQRAPGGSVFAVISAPAPAAPRIHAIVVPDRVDLESRVAVQVTVGVGADATGPLHVTLLSGGVPQDEQSLPVLKTDGNLTVPMTFVPAQPGLVMIEVRASLPGGEDTSAVASTHVVQRERRVLVHEARPSWAATFIRRALESDPRLNVTARSVVSRGLAAEAGAPPALDDPAALNDFDVIVIGAAEALAPAQVSTLERYLRTREGAVVLLPTDEDALGVLRPLTQVSRWTVDRRPTLQAIEAGGLRWSASEFLWPGTWPVGAEALATCLTAAPKCAVWRRPVGGGRVMVSSALDGWRTRAADDVDYAEFWRVQVAGEAATTPERISVILADAIVEPGALIQATVESRGLSGADAEWQDTIGGRGDVRLWPEGEGRWRAEWAAPVTPGRYRLVVTAQDVTASREFMVVEPEHAPRPVPESDEALALMARAHGGRAVPIAEAASLRAELAALAEAPAGATWHPFRTAWMIVPFAGALSVEWWLRRRRGAR